MNLNGIRGSFFIALKGRILRIREFSMEDQKMNFYHQLDAIMKQDMGGRGLLTSLPENPIKEAAESLRHAARVILLTGFPVRMEDGGCIGETDGPSGTANLAFAFTQVGAQVLVVTDRASYHLLEEALSYRAPKAALSMIPEAAFGDFIRDCIRSFRPTHFISLERPGKALDGHYHNMRGETIDDMITDSALFLSEARAFGAETISIGDGGNEMGMGTYRHEIEAHVPCGKLICASEAADITLASGVSNWWGWGIAALLSLQAGLYLLPTESQEAELLHRVVEAGGVDGCTKEHTETVDHLSLAVHLSVLRSVSQALTAQMEENGQASVFFSSVSSRPVQASRAGRPDCRENRPLGGLCRILTKRPDCPPRDLSCVRPPGLFLSFYIPIPLRR